MLVNNWILEAKVVNYGETEVKCSLIVQDYQRGVIKKHPFQSRNFVFWPSIENRTSKWTCIASWHEIRKFLLYVNATVISSIRTSVSIRGNILEKSWYLLITEILHDFLENSSVIKSWMHNKLYYKNYIKNLQWWLEKAQNQITSHYVWKLAKVSLIHLATVNDFALIHGCMSQCCGRTVRVSHSIICFSSMPTIFSPKCKKLAL